MAFNFPPNNDRPLPYTSPNSSNYSYFTEQAIRAGYGVPDDPRVAEVQRPTIDAREAIRADYGVLDDPRQAEVQRPSVNARESVEREIMRERIRAEIMAEEMARRRALEQEVRMELMLEREMALQRLDSSRMRFDSYSGVPYVHESSGISQPVGHLEERRLGLLPMTPVHREPGFLGLGLSPFQRHPMAAPPEPRKETILLAKPETDISGLKPKAPTPVSDHHKASYIGLEKKPKHNMGLEKKPKGNIGLGKKPNGNTGMEKKPNEWKCELCNIKTTSEFDLKEHMQGKKHKDNEEGLGAHSIGFDTSADTNKSSAGTRKPKAFVSTSNPNVKNARKTYGKSSENTTGKTTTVEKTQNGKLKKYVQVYSTSNPKAKAVDSVKNGKPGDPTAPNSAGPSEKFRFWCEMCQVGASSATVFASHEKGKKHLAMLEEHNAAPRSAPAVPSRSSRKV